MYVRLECTSIFNLAFLIRWTTHLKEAVKTLTDAKGQCCSPAAIAAAKDLQAHIQKMRLMEVEMDSVASFNCDGEGIEITAAKAWGVPFTPIGVPSMRPFRVSFGTDFVSLG